jgi:hypothetical protein
MKNAAFDEELSLNCRLSVPDWFHYKYFLPIFTQLYSIQQVYNDFHPNEELYNNILKEKSYNPLDVSPTFSSNTNNNHTFTLSETLKKIIDQGEDSKKQMTTEFYPLFDLQRIQDLLHHDQRPLCGPATNLTTQETNGTSDDEINDQIKDHTPLNYSNIKDTDSTRSNNQITDDVEEGKDAKENSTISFPQPQLFPISPYSAKAIHYNIVYHKGVYNSHLSENGNDNNENIFINNNFLNNYELSCFFSALNIATQNINDTETYNLDDMGQEVNLSLPPKAHSPFNTDFTSSPFIDDSQNDKENQVHFNNNNEKNLWNIINQAVEESQPGYNINSNVHKTNITVDFNRFKGDKFENIRNVSTISDLIRMVISRDDLRSLL